MWKGLATEDILYFGRTTDQGDKRYIRLTWKDLDKAPYDLFKSCLDKPISAYKEVDEKWFSWQPNNLLTYHAFTILEVENVGWFGEKLFIMIERCTETVQLLYGLGSEVELFVSQFYANGQQRNTHQCSSQPRVKLSSSVTVRQLIEWMDKAVAKNWGPYNLLAKNCQHFASDLQRFLHNPRQAQEHMWNEKEIMVKSLRPDVANLDKFLDRLLGEHTEPEQESSLANQSHRSPRFLLVCLTT